MRRKQESNPKDISVVGECIIGIKGTYYDITNYAPHHPGGDVITEFHNQDATAQFLVYHSKSVLKRLKYLKIVGTYEFDEDKPFGSKLHRVIG